MRACFLTLFVQIDYDVRDVITMVADLGVPGRLHSDEGGIVELGDQAEDLGLP